MVGTVVKAKIGELEEEVRVGSSRRTRKELTVVVQDVSGRRRFLVNQTLKTLLPTKHRTHHDHLTFYFFFSRSPSQRAKIEGQGEQDRGGDSCQGKNRRVRGGGKGR